jgi:hypothetical protein
MCPSVCLIGLLQREQKYKSLSGAQSLSRRIESSTNKSTRTENDWSEHANPVNANETQCQHDSRISDRNIYDADARQTICSWMFHVSIFPGFALDVLTERPPDNCHQYSFTADGGLFRSVKRACSHFDALY